MNHPENEPDQLKLPNSPNPPNQPTAVPQTEDRLDRLLAHLNQAEAPAGLNDRLLQRLSPGLDAPGAPSQTRSRRPSLRHPSPRPLWALGLTFASIAALAVFTLLPAHPNRSHPQPIGQSTRVATTTNAAPPSLPSAPSLPAAPSPTAAPIPTVVPSPTAVPSPTRTPIPAQPSDLKIPSLAARNHLRPLPALRPKPLSPEEAQALDDLHTPSLPAPPLPLTTQEKAILHLLRRNGAVELAQLDPSAQAKAFELQRADFQQFFDPPPPSKPKGDANEQTHVQ